LKGIKLYLWLFKSFMCTNRGRDQFIQSVWWRTQLRNGITGRWAEGFVAFGAQFVPNDVWWFVAFDRAGRVQNRSWSRRRVSDYSTCWPTSNSQLLHVCRMSKNLFIIIFIHLLL
jgi:hypothetical protein